MNECLVLLNGWVGGTSLPPQELVDHHETLQGDLAMVAFYIISSLQTIAV